VNQETFVAHASVKIAAPVREVWDALVNPQTIRTYMFGTEVVSEWKKNSPIVWKGVWKDKPYQDHGTIVEIVPEKRLKYSHFSPLSGVADVPENYHTLAFDLTQEGEAVVLALAQDNNHSVEEQKHSEGMYMAMLQGLKKLLEK